MLPRYAFGITVEHACIDSVEPRPLAKVTNGWEVRGKGRWGGQWLVVIVLVGVIDVVNQVPHGVAQNRLEIKSNKKS